MEEEKTFGADKNKEISNVPTENGSISIVKQNGHAKPNGDQESEMSSLTDSKLDGYTKKEELSKDSSSSTDASKNSAKYKVAYGLLAEGNKNLLIRDYALAVTNLGQCCEMFVDIFGHLAPECGDAYYAYGSACLELAKEENVLLDTEMKSDNRNLSDESKQNNDAEEKELDTEKVASAVKDKEDDGDDNDDDDDKEDDDDDDDDKENSDIEDEEVEEKEDSISDDDINVANTEDDVDTLQLAWESFECAKKIYESQNNIPKLVDLYIKLSEVSILSGNHSTAIEDLTLLLNMCEDQLEPNSQTLADIYYQLSVAYNLNSQYDEGIEQAEKAYNIISHLISNMRGIDAKQKEMLSLHDFLKVLHDSLVDMKASKETIQVKKSVSEDVSSCVVATEPSAESTAVANDISHLVRRKGTKRKLEQDENVEA